MSKQPTPEQTPERIAETQTRKNRRERRAVALASLSHLLTVATRHYHDDRPSLDDLNSAFRTVQSTLEDFEHEANKEEATLAHLTQERENERREHRVRLRLHMEEVVLARRERDERHALQLQAEATLARVKAQQDEARLTLAALVEWHDGRFVQNLGEPFAAIVRSARAALVDPPVEGGK